MTKTALLNWKSWWWPLQKHNCLVVMLGISFLLVGLFYGLLFSPSNGLSVVSESPFEHAVTSSLPPPVCLIPPEGLQPVIPKANLSGVWIPHPDGPVYTNESCKFIEDHQNWLKNGRPDTGCLYWRWKPRECVLPKFNPGRFLALMRNKAWALIGDSIIPNHVQSFICILSKKGEFALNELVRRILRNIKLKEFRNASGRASEKGINLKTFSL